MIQSLHISGFKLFRDLTLPRFGRMNLFVGENNTGKSCLLEAIGLYAGRNPLTDILEALSRRSADKTLPWTTEGMNEESRPIRHPIFDLFHWADPTITAPIIIEKIGDRYPLRVAFRWHHRVTDENGVTRYIPTSPGEVVVEPLEMALPVYRGDKQVALITRRMLEGDRIADTENLFNEGALAVAYLPASGFTERKAASMWDALIQGPGQKMVLDWLRMLEPRVEDLAYIGEPGYQRSRVALLKVEAEGRIPLRSMGDGMTRLFHVGLAMASAPRGLLLIDEFENGLHWRIQEKLWGVLSRIAQTSGVQVFATTHSRDCIDSFTKAAKALGAGEGMIYRLERIGGDIFPADLPLINVDAAMRVHQEVR